MPTKVKFILKFRNDINTKEILEKVSFNSELFHKELEKAIKKLFPHEIEELKIWLNSFTVILFQHIKYTQKKC